MVEFTLTGLFKTTNMGIPAIDPLPTETNLSSSFYGCSVTIQCLIFFYFVLYFAVSIARVMKKIKNPKFKDVQKEFRNEENQNKKEENDQKQKMKRERQAQMKEQSSEKPPNVILYRFDGDEEEQDKRKKQEAPIDYENEKYKENGKEETTKVEETAENYDEYHDEKEEYYIQLDNKLMFLQPFLISFIICNNIFAADIITVISLVFMLLTYYLFNVKEFLSHIKLAPILFIFFSLCGFLSFYMNDHDLST